MKPNTVSKHIPDDVAFSILSKLPLKSVKRFSCVRKSWARLFENTYFMSMFRDNFLSTWRSNYDDTCVLLKQTNEERRDDVMYKLSGENNVKLDWPPPFKEYHHCILILGSAVNGILCLYNYYQYVLWNPTTQQFKVIPFSPMPCVVSCGFGYDHVRDDYKVIQGRIIDHSISYEIYSLRSNSWRNFGVDKYIPIAHNFNVAGVHVYMTGACHWWGETYSDGNFYLVSFDLRNEVFLTTPMPIKYVAGFMSYVHLVVLNGSIALISNSPNSETTFDISILGQLGVKESWITLFTIEPLPCIEHPIGVGNKGDILFGRKDCELASFDLNT